MSEDKLATELLKQINADKKRWFIIAVVELILLLSTIGIFMWYISLPMESNVIEQDSDTNSYNQIIGGDVNGVETESKTCTESGAQ